MTRITSSDQVLMLLREQLQRMGKGRPGGAGRAAAAGRSQAAAPMVRIRALVARSELSDEEFGRCLVRALVAEQLGEQVAQDPGLQAVLDDVFRIVSENDETRQLLARATGQMKTAS